MFLKYVSIPHLFGDAGIMFYPPKKNDHYITNSKWIAHIMKPSLESRTVCIYCRYRVYVIILLACPIDRDS